MRVVFRVDASLTMGSGHLMRCLALAEALALRGAQCDFVSREHPGNLLDLIRQRRFGLTVLPFSAGAASDSDTTGSTGGNAAPHAAWLGCDWQTDARQTSASLVQSNPHWLVVDHYALDRQWEAEVRQHGHKLMVIDDLADRDHDCDLLLDQNLGRAEGDYAGLVPMQCRLLTGAQYALLRPEFHALRRVSLARRRQPALRRILVTMGGVDLPNATGQVLGALKRCDLSDDCEIRVVMGMKAPWLERVRELASDMPWATKVLVSIGDMAQQMSDSDLCIGAAGSTAWERCCLGLPTLMVVLADNQKQSAVHLEDAGAACCITMGPTMQEQIQSRLTSLMNQPDLLSGMAMRASRVADGAGTGRVVTAMESACRHS